MTNQTNTTEEKFDLLQGLLNEASDRKFFREFGDALSEFLGKTERLTGINLLHSKNEDISEGMRVIASQIWLLKHNDTIRRELEAAARIIYTEETMEKMLKSLASEPVQTD